MMNETQLLTTLGEDTRAIYNNQKIIRENLIKKWKKTRLLEKLDHDRQSNMAQLLENEAAALYGLLQESSLNSAVAGFAKIAFPLVRRVFANLIADKIVAIQPMSLPVGLLFYLDFQYDANTSKPPYSAGGSLYGNLSFGGNSALEGLGAQLATGGFYGLNASYGYRKFASGSTLTASTFYDNGIVATSSNTATWVSSFVGEDGKTYTAQRYEFNFGANITSVDLANLRQFVVVQASTIATDNGTPYNGFSGVLSASNAYPIIVGETALSGAAVNPSTQTLTSGKIVVWSTSGSLVGTTDTVTAGQMLFIAATSLDNRAEFEAVGNIPEIDLSIKKVQVGTQTRKLKTKWTPELAQDINAYQGIDAELELTKILSEQIITDIDRELISDLITGAHFRDVWSRKIGKYVTLNASNQVVTNTTNSDILGFGNGSNGAGPVFRGTQKEWYQTLIEKINKMSYKIFQVVLRGKANFIVTSATVAGMLESTEDYRMEIEANKTVGQVGVIKAGTLQNRYNIYVDPYLPDAIILVGFKGEGFLNAGFVYAPYIPLVAVPTLFDPESFTPRKGVLSRYGKQMVRPDYYGVIYALDLDLF
jgi:hypothetical protein